MYIESLNYFIRYKDVRNMIEVIQGIYENPESPGLAHILGKSLQKVISQL